MMNPCICRHVSRLAIEPVDLGMSSVVSVVLALVPHVSSTEGRGCSAGRQGQMGSAGVLWSGGAAWSSGSQTALALRPTTSYSYPSLSCNPNSIEFKNKKVNIGPTVIPAFIAH